MWQQRSRPAFTAACNDSPPIVTCRMQPLIPASKSATDDRHQLLPARTKHALEEHHLFALLD
jgi:hypothetical protein